MLITDKIEKLRKEKGWSICELTKHTNLSENTVYNWYKRGGNPSVEALESICGAFGITLSAFFADDENDKLFADEIELIKVFRSLTEEQRKSLLRFLSLL